MARSCTVCRHDDREAIDHALVGGLPYRDIARRWGVTISALSRHSQGHVSPALARVAAERERDHATSLLERVEDLYVRARGILDAAEADGKPSLSLAAIRELRATAELLGKLTGELDDRPSQTVNLLVAPEWLALRGTVLEALGPYPEAREAVARSVASLEAS